MLEAFRAQFDNILILPLSVNPPLSLSYLAYYILDKPIHKQKYNYCRSSSKRQRARSAVVRT